jgi:hypothetical protein
MDLAAKLDDVGKPIWIVGLVLGFIWWWPLGMVILAYLLWSGRMGRWKHARGCWGRWHQAEDNGTRRYEAPRGSSGNRAFDEYRTETLKRLEDEQQEFHQFLDRLRLAKDKAEFDQFMAERRRSQGPTTEAPPAA